MKPTEQDIAAAKAKHPDAGLQLLTHEDISIIVKPPSRADWARFMKTSADADRRDKALPNLVECCRVWPSDADWAGIVERLPGLVETFGGKLTEIAGLAKDAEAKKL